jgi:hypothetical protein
VKKPGAVSQRERDWFFRFSGITLLSGIAAVLAHLLAGGSIGSLFGLVLGSVSAALVAMVSLYRPGFLRTVVAMVVGQYVFHTFLGLGATSGAHHHTQSVLSSTIDVSGDQTMTLSHALAALVVGVLVSGAEHALRVVAFIVEALKRLGLPKVPSPVSLTEFSWRRMAVFFSEFLTLAARDELCSKGVRGPPRAV